MPNGLKTHEITTQDVEKLDSARDTLREIVMARAGDNLLIEELRTICMSLNSICPIPKIAPRSDNGPWSAA